MSLTELRASDALQTIRDTLPVLFGPTATEQIDITGWTLEEQIEITCWALEWIADDVQRFEVFEAERWAHPSSFADIYAQIDFATGGQLAMKCPDRNLFAFLFGMARAAWIMSATKYN